MKGCWYLSPGSIIHGWVGEIKILASQFGKASFAKKSRKHGGSTTTSWPGHSFRIHLKQLNMKSAACLIFFLVSTVQKPGPSHSTTSHHIPQTYVYTYYLYFNCSRISYLNCFHQRRSKLHMSGCLSHGSLVAESSCRMPKLPHRATEPGLNCEAGQAGFGLKAPHTAHLLSH